MSLLRVQGLGRAYGTRRVLADLSFALDEGERLAVLGPSGSGKTTLIRLLAGLDAPGSGEIEIAGRLASSEGRIVLPPERRGVALVFQGLALFPHMTVLEQVRFAARSPEWARDVLGRVGLGDRTGALPSELSGGERQRLALARALAQEPRVLLVDEPFGSLDPDLHATLRSEVRALLDAQKTTLVVVTHAREDALELAERLIVLDGGREVVSGEIAALVARPRRTAVVRALGLGHVVAGRVSGPGRVSTLLGPASARLDGREGEVSLLVRPDQARVLGEEEFGGVPAEVVSVGIAAPEARLLRHGVIVRVGGALLAARAAEPAPRPGAKVRVALEGELEPVEE